MDLALTREVSPRINRCELTFIERRPIDAARAVAQHRQYCLLLESLGLELLSLPGDPACPDCCFVEDTAVVLDELALITRLGSEPRRRESAAVAKALAPHRSLVEMQPPATLEGGDVLLVGRTLFVGLSKRTNQEGVEALRRAVGPHGYTVTPVEVGGCLHLKSAASALDEQTLIVNPIWVDPKAFPGIEVLSTPAKEPSAANVLRVGAELVVHSGFPQTAEVLAQRGHSVRTLDVSEFLKAEAGVTCKSILFRRL